MMDMRYLGQNYELTLEIKDGKLESGSLRLLMARYHKRHLEFYGYDMAEQPVEVVSLRLAVTIERDAPTPEKVSFSSGSIKGAVAERRKVWFPETGFVTAPIYSRDRLPANCRLEGPAVIEQMDTTTVVPPRAKVKNDKFGYLHIDVEPIAPKGGN